MRWQGAGRSDNVEDRRRMSPAAVGGGVGGLVVLALVYFLTGDVRLAQQAGQLAQQQAPRQQASSEPIDDRTFQFAGAVLKLTEDVWHEQFRAIGKRYDEPKFVLFSQAVDSGCGRAPAEVGPFYCPADRKLYLDPTFFQELEQKLGGSKAEFSQAYVIAHEVGHHVQNLLGYNRLVDQFERREGKNASVRLELQADYLAGVWAHHAQARFNILERGDVESAITTAQAIGDDRIQSNSRGWVSPEAFTHGSAAQRTKWFKEGLRSGDFSQQALDRFFDPKVNPLEL